ncbi:MAG: hypothetical protein AABY22_34690 [Nanoarchaeota archaeon]
MKKYNQIDISNERFYADVITSEECWNCGRRISNSLSKCPSCEIENNNFVKFDKEV